MKNIVFLAVLAIMAGLPAMSQNKSIDKFCEKNLLATKATAAEYLAAMDHDLDQIAKGGEACGSFTDYFAINGWEALKVGASRSQVRQRVDRLVSLAQKKKYLSGYEIELVTRGGTAEIRKYMEEIILSAKQPVSDFAVPNWVQAQLAKMKSGKNVDSPGIFGHGTGIYRVHTDKVVPFYWYSFSNSDGYEQIAITTSILGFDRRAILSIRDKLNRNYDAWSSKDISWIGVTNDMWLTGVHGNPRYVHIKKWTNLPGGGKVGEYAFHYEILKNDYLDRITRATRGALQFNVAELN